MDLDNQQRQSLFNLIAIIAGIIALIVLMSILLQTVFGEYKEKNVTLTLYKNTMHWCFFGNDKKPTAVCNSMELDDKYRLIDNFLQYLEHGPTLEK